jgi:hypothetical protein
MSIPAQVETEVAQRGGRPVVVKRAADEAGAGQLNREARRLSAAGHPGVVELLDHDVAMLTLAWAGDQTLETHRPALPAAAAVLTALAETIADLHEMGVVHGRLSGDHVVIDAAGRPRLCGMCGVDPEAQQPTTADDVAALGRLIDQLVGPGAELEPIPERRWGRRRWTGYQRRALQTLADQATDPNPEHRPRARDLAAALAATVPEAHLVPAGAPVEVAISDLSALDTATRSEPEPEPEPKPKPEPEPEPEPDRRIEELAEHPIDALVEPSAADLIAPSVDPGHARGGSADAPEPQSPEAWPDVDMFLGMRLSDAVEHDDRHPASGIGPTPRPIAPVAIGSTSRSPVRRVLAVAAGLLLAVVAVSVMRTGSPPRDRAEGVQRAAVRAAQEADTSDVAPRADAAGHDPAPPAVDATCAPVAPPSADGDGDGCPDAIGVTGSAIQVGAVRYRLGADGDDVTVGDWDCDGQATPALVRPSTGEVFVFSQWATVDAPVSLEPTAVVAGAAGPVPAERCGPLRVRTADGTIKTVTEAPR